MRAQNSGPLLGSLVALWAIRVTQQMFTWQAISLTPHLALKIYFLDFFFILLYILPACMYAPFMCSVYECACVSVHC